MIFSLICDGTGRLFLRIELRLLENSQKIATYRVPGVECALELTSYASQHPRQDVPRWVQVSAGWWGRLVVHTVAKNAEIHQ